MPPQDDTTTTPPTGGYQSPADPPTGMPEPEASTVDATTPATEPMGEPAPTAPAEETPSTDQPTA